MVKKGSRAGSTLRSLRPAPAFVGDVTSSPKAIHEVDMLEMGRATGLGSAICLG